LIDKGYQSVFENLPKEKQSELIRRKVDFAIIAEIAL
jgi:hypothetical protein